MFKQVFTSAELPQYHEKMLVVKLRPEAGALLAAAAAPPPSRAFPTSAGPAFADEPAAFPTSGFAALSAFDRGGLIRRVTPVSRQAEETLSALGPRRAMSALAASAGEGPRTRRAAAVPPDFNAGVNVVELEREADVSELQVALANDPHVEFVSRVPVRYLVASTSKKGRASKRTVAATPPAASTMWNLRKVQWAQARALRGFKDANDVKVAVLDSGIEKEHPDLRGRVAGYVYAHPDVPNVSGERDIIGHGTHVSGTIAALINNNLGINGICNCRLLAWKIFDDQEDFFRDAFVYLYFVDTVMYMRALADCLEQGVDVINLSIGGGGRPDPQEQQLFDALLASGTVIVAAMGNEREDGSPISYPAAIPGVIAVGATSIDDTVAEFSNHGDHISLSAPGVGIWSTLPRYPGQSGFDAVLGPGNRPVKGRPRRRETDYGAWDGTSMASPHVAAAAALLTAKHGRLGPEETRRRLVRKSDRVAGMGGANFHPDFGAGRLNLLRLLS